jgi:hypothetical protein
MLTASSSVYQMAACSGFGDVRQQLAAALVLVVAVAASDFGGSSGRVVFTGPSQEHVYLSSTIDAD